MRHRVLPHLFLLAGLAMLGACAGQRFGEIESHDFPVVSTRGENATLGSTQIELLFSGVTAYGQRLPDHTEFKRYYSRDGRVIDLDPLQGRHEGRWRTMANQLCINWDGRQECAYIKRENHRIGQYRESASGAPQKTISYERFLRGNPEQLE